MSYAREKRILLGLLAFLAPIPLPFNQILSWPALALYLLGVALYLRRTLQGRAGWLPQWAMNVLGLLYIPFFLLDLLVLSGGRLVVPVVHLGLFAVLVKLWSLGRERDKWQALMGIFFLFLAAMATSVHPSAVLYLLVFGVLATLALSRFAFLHLEAGFGRSAAGAPKVPFKGFLALSIVLAIVLAVPLFALLPRMQAPYIMARGSGPFGGGQTTGFSDDVTLDSIGQVRTSREVALRFQSEGRLAPFIDRADDLRFKAGTFDVYDNHRWSKTPDRQVLRARRGGAFELAEGRPEAWAEIWLQPLGSTALVVPTETVRLEAPLGWVGLGEGGTLTLSSPPRDVLRYKVGLAAEPVSLGEPPTDSEALDRTGVTAAMIELAERVTGSGTSREQAERLERHFITEYQYTLDFLGRRTEDPLQDFLFESKSGHCEYFATSMVLLLRTQAIPARLVTGFLGAEYNPIEGYFIVRQSNAHAWVEAWMEEEGRWRAFDPTPPSGRPTGGRASLWSLATQAYDYVLFRWDRYVLTYDFGDQLRFLGGLREAWSSFWDALRRERPEEPPAPGAEAPAPDDGESVLDEPVLAPDWQVWLLAVALLAVLVGVWLVWRRRSPLTATGAYRRLRRTLRHGGLEVSDADPPLAVRRALLDRYPATREPSGRLFHFYLTESFAGHDLSEAEREELKRSLAETLQSMRKAG